MQSSLSGKEVETYWIFFICFQEKIESSLLENCTIRRNFLKSKFKHSINFSLAVNKNLFKADDDL
jgi:hypothetical protein